MSGVAQRWDQDCIQGCVGRSLRKRAEIRNEAARGPALPGTYIFRSYNAADQAKVINGLDI